MATLPHRIVGALVSSYRSDLKSALKGHII